MKKFLQFWGVETNQNMQELKQLAALQAKLHHWQAKSKRQNATIRQLKQRNEELTQSRQSWKQKALRSLPPPTQGPIAQQQAYKPARYRYSVPLITQCISLYLTLGCGYRSLLKLLATLAQQSPAPCPPLPSKSTLALWLQKLGCARYQQQAQPTQTPVAPYALLVDESMVIGTHRLLVALALPAPKTPYTTIDFSQVRLVGLWVAPSWNQQTIAQRLQTLSQHQGRPPAYVVSDGDRKLRLGIQQAGLRGLSDVGHQVALLLEHHYKRLPAFLAWQQSLTQLRYRGIMTAHAYLLPPCQRSIARFMNLNEVVSWGQRLLANWARLSEAEQTFFGELLAHRPLLAELGRVLAFSEGWLALFRQQGLSQATVKQAGERLAAQAHELPRALVVSFEQCLSEQASLLVEGECAHCCSSVIESLFGSWKQHQPSGKLVGITGHVLQLALRVGGGLGADVGSSLESMPVSTLSAWKQANLPVSMVGQRRNMLRKVNEEKG